MTAINTHLSKVTLNINIIKMAIKRHKFIGLLFFLILCVLIFWILIFYLSYMWQNLNFLFIQFTVFFIVQILVLWGPICKLLTLIPEWMDFFWESCVTKGTTYLIPAVSALQILHWSFSSIWSWLFLQGERHRYNFILLDVDI